MLLLVLACHRPPPPPDCGPDVPGLADIVHPGAMVVFGEVHGTTETPAFVGRAACAFVAGGLPVTVGMEITRDEQPRIDAYLGSDGGPDTRAALLAGPFWTREYQDGRSSAAMVGLIETARTLLVPVLAFDQGGTDDGSVPRDTRMARRLLEARAADPDRATVVLVGNLHARRKSGLPPAPEMVPMAAVLAPESPSLVTLNVLTGGGSYWACFGSEVSDCGVKESPPKEDPGPMRVDRTLDREAYDGVYVVGRVSAARPATAEGP